MRKHTTGPVAVYLSELSEGSRRTMGRALATACTFFGGTDPATFRWHKVRVDQVAALRSDLAARFAPNTANKVLAAVRGVLRACWRMGLLSAEDLYRCGDVRAVKGGPAKRGRCLSRDELTAVFRACGEGSGGRRDAAALACLYGCRRSEPVSLDLCDYDPKSGRLRIREAKGNKHRDVYLTNGAIVTSANLTDAALLHNHEFGFITQAQAVVRPCRQYFERLWAAAGADLTPERLSGWESRLARHLMAGGRRATTVLGDEGTVIGAGRAAGLPEGWVAAADQAFVKLWGESTNRLPLDYPVIEEVRRAGGHWACTYPKGQRPRQVKDGALMFMGRLVKEPNDIRVIGRAIGMGYVDGRDDATPAEMRPPRQWKRQWPHYVRVHDAVFVGGNMANGVSLNALMDELGADSFASTQRNRAKGSGNVTPRKAYRQKPAVQLSEQGRIWLANRLEQAFGDHGTQPPEVMESLDWPKLQLGTGGGRVRLRGRRE